VVSYIDGVAASVASVIAMAGDEIIIAENAWMMIHDAWGLAMGNAADLRRQADLMDSQSAVMADLYAARTKYPKDKVRQMMTDETWMSSADAIKYGFASSISENMRVAAHAKAGAMYGFRHLPSMLGGKASTEPDDAEKALRARASQRAQRVQQARLQQSFRQRATQPTNGAST
jgi:ATP-dependent Clp protease protease subunit